MKYCLKKISRFYALRHPQNLFFMRIPSQSGGGVEIFSGGVGIFSGGLELPSVSQKFSPLTAAKIIMYKY